MSEPKPTEEQLMQQAKMLWLAFLPSHAILIGVGVFVHAPGELDLVLVAVCAVAAVSACLAALFAVRRIIKQPGAGYILRYALGESATLMGIVLAASAGVPIWLSAVFGGLGIVTHLLCRPTDEAYTQWLLEGMD